MVLRRKCHADVNGDALAAPTDAAVWTAVEVFARAAAGGRREKTAARAAQATKGREWWLSGRRRRKERVVEQAMSFEGARGRRLSSQGAENFNL